MWTRSPLLKSERPYNAPNVQNIRLQRPSGKRREAARDNTVLEKSQEYVCIVAPIKGWALREGGKSPKHHGIPRKDIRLWACSSGGQSLMSAWQHKLMSLPMWASWSYFCRSTRSPIFLGKVSRQRHIWGGLNAHIKSVKRECVFFKKNIEKEWQ